MNITVAAGSVSAAYGSSPTLDNSATYQIGGETDWIDVNGKNLAPHLYEPTPTILLGNAAVRSGKRLDGNDQTNEHCRTAVE